MNIHIQLTCHINSCFQGMFRSCHWWSTRVQNGLPINVSSKV